MRRYKNYSYALVLLLLCYWFFNLIVWKMFTQDVLANTECRGGDLSRMGYIKSSIMCRTSENNLPRRHIEQENYTNQKIGLLTLGDSFSGGGGGGTNRYYQDYLSSINNFDVLNIVRYKKLDKISTISVLNNNGYLDRVKPAYVLIQCSEKDCLNDLPETIDFSRSIPEKELERYERIRFLKPPPVKIAAGFVKLDFFSEANYKLVRNSILYNFSDNAFDCQVYKGRLNRSFFSVDAADTLLFLDSDIKSRPKSTSQNIARMNEFLNTLADRLAEKGISLCFMPCVDKHNLYSKFLIDNKYPDSRFFEELRKLQKRYELIDTKEILLKELENGIKDIYYADDTHWSWKASKKIFETVRFR